MEVRFTDVLIDNHGHRTCFAYVDGEPAYFMDCHKRRWHFCFMENAIVHGEDNAYSSLKACKAAIEDEVAEPDWADDKFKSDLSWTYKASVGLTE